MLAVAGPVVVHTGGVNGLAALIRGGCIQCLLSGNALGVHDVEAALFGTSLGIRQSDGRQEEHERHTVAVREVGDKGDQREQGRKRSTGHLGQASRRNRTFLYPDPSLSSHVVRYQAVS